MRKISFDKYREKVLGGWLGKSLGGTIGRFEGIRHITDFTVEELLPDGLFANDDLDIQLIWIDVLLDKGIYFESSDLMRAWIDQYDFNFSEYGISRRNFTRGIIPPVSGWYANEYYKTGMGCPIRSEIWGMISPGCPELATAYAYKDGILDHEGESVWAEQFLAVMEAEAFFQSDIEELIMAGLAVVPKESHLYKCITDVISFYKAKWGWKDIWKYLKIHHSHPDCTYSPFNLAIIVMGLLYGEGDFKKTMEITVNSGWDIDCTCSSSAALLGIIHGAENFGENWLKFAGDKVVTYARPKHQMDKLSLVTDYTCRAGATMIRELSKDVMIEGIPGELEYIPVIKKVPGLVWEIDYKGLPAIGYGENKQLGMYIENTGSEHISGVLNFQLPEGLRADKNNIPVKIERGERIYLSFNINISIGTQSESVTILAGGTKMASCTNTESNIESAGGTDMISDTNIISAGITTPEGRIYNYSFGLCGTPVCSVLGPFFDTYEKWYDMDKLPDWRILKVGNKKEIMPVKGEEWGNYRVDIEIPYIEEDFSDALKTRSQFAKGSMTNCYSDRYQIKDVFGMQGPCCVYYYQEIVLPEERELDLFIGSTDPYRIWVNGELLYTQKENRFWFSSNDVITTRFNKGINHIVLKIARKGSDNCLTMAARYLPNAGGYDGSPYITDFKFMIPVNSSNVETKEENLY